MIDPKPYLDYLDKEMTIMGLLSAFSVALASFATERIVSADRGFLTEVWTVGCDHVMAGAVTAILASFFFYLQRSHLAWYYGQISLAQSRGAASPNPVGYWLTQADGWDTWVRYQSGFIALIFSFACYAYAVAEALCPLFGSISRKWSLWMPLFIAFLIIVVRWRVLAKFAQEDQPFSSCWRALRKSNHGMKAT